MKYHMGTLFAVMAVTFIYAYSGNGNTNYKKLAIQISTIILGTFLGLRTWWMADLMKYHTQYVSCGGDNWKEIVFQKPENLGLRLFFRIEHVLTGGNYQIALLIIAFFIMISVGYVVYKYSVSPYWSYLMYIAMGFYFFNFSGLKQSVAMGFLLWAFVGIIEEKLGLFLMMTFVAGMFHAPAFIFLPAYFWAKKKNDKLYWLLLIAIFALIFVFRNQIVGFLGEMYYEESEFMQSSKNVGGKFLMILAMLIGGAVLRPPVSNDTVYSKVYNLTVIAALLQSFSVFGNNFTRLADYYFQIIILFIPFVFEYRGPRVHVLSVNARPSLIRLRQKEYVLMYLGVTVFLLYFYYNYIVGDISGITNYKFFWEVLETPWGS